MEMKLLAVAVVTFLLLIDTGVYADFWFNHNYKQYEDEAAREERGLICVPGRTTIKIKEPEVQLITKDSDEMEEEEPVRRTHMNFAKADSDTCEVCVCSAEGKDEFCSKRPAYNVNECLRQQMLIAENEKNGAFDHERTLAFRTRRDLIWHDDEIPYQARARCERAHSYYTNNPNANDTDIDQGSDMNSYIDYKGGADICFYCVCSVNGLDIYCVPRDKWFCDYYRYIRIPTAMREMYSVMFKQDRPAYFRQLSWRLRRTMDDGIYALINSVHHIDHIDQSKGCIPFVSQYTDCSEANICTGCTRCMCSEDGAWLCDKISECKANPVPPVDEDTLDSALNTLIEKIAKDSDTVRKPKPKEDRLLNGGKSNEELLLGNNGNDIEMQIIKLISSKPRHKRSPKLEVQNDLKIKSKEENGTIKFYHTVDEVNEDTLKHSNLSGTLGAAKVEPLNLPNLSRRTASVSGNSSNDLALDSLSKINLDHISDNKIDVTHGNETAELLHHEMIGIKTNYTQKQKDSDLSKIIVNELKGGKEHIGEVEAPVMSNITFRPENDTLTAMAFIAGNLLNKLWSMEKATSGESQETEALKQEKIADLLDLFKEPLTVRQESFLRNALSKLSEAIENKNVKDIALCDDIVQARQNLTDSEHNDSNKKIVTFRKSDITTEKVTTQPLKNNKPNNSTKLKKVMGLIKKFETINAHINNLKGLKEVQEKPHTNLRFAHYTEKTLDNPFGTILEKITKLLLPSKHVKSMMNKIRKQNVLSNNDYDIKRKFKQAFNFDLSNIHLTLKDKLVLDYLTKIKADPSMLLSSGTDTENDEPSNIEGDILLNLSEFFKVKSFIDLMRLLDADKRKSTGKNDMLRTFEDTPTLVTDIPETTTIMTQIKEVSTNDPITFAKTKEKLKQHLKTILEDLVELQKEQGKGKGKNIKISDALPCIYNLLHESEGIQNKIDEGEVKPLTKISDIFDAMKKELKDGSQNSRRTLDIVTAERPKSAAVWERVIKSVDNIQKKISRRISNDPTPKSYTELKAMIDQIECNSKLYKTNTLENDVPAADKLMLLKTLEQEVKQYIEVLENIKLSLEYNDKLTREQYRDLKEFIENAGSNFKLNGKVIATLDKTKKRPTKFENNLIPKINNKMSFKQSEKIRLESQEIQSEPRGHVTDVKFTRDELLNQLIRNRVMQFLKDKKERGDYSVDINDGIARNILESFDKGNDQLARDLYKIFVNNKLITPEADLRRYKMLDREPLIQFEGPNSLPVPMSLGMSGQSNAILRQLLDVRNTKRMI